MMSEEVVAPKKRGRPRKVVAVEVEGEKEVVAKEVKTKSKTSKTPKAEKPTKTRTRKAKTSGKVETEPTEVLMAAKPLEIESSPVSSEVSTLPKQPTESQSSRIKSTVTTKTSKILEQVRELSTQATAQAPTKPKTAKPIPVSTKSEASKSSSSPPLVPSEAVPQKPSPPSQAPTPSSQIPTTKPKPISQSPSTATQTKIPLAAFNSAIVSNISERAGARPNTAGSRALPKNYQNTARKVTMTIVALPIAIVTSYVLYQRLVLGEQKQLLVAPSRPVETPSVQINVVENE